MFILPVLFAALGASGAAPYPDDFVAHCSHGQETRVYVNPDWSHSMQQKDNGNTYRVDIRRENGQFIVWSLGPDYQIGMANGEDWKLDVLKQQRGDLALVLQTSSHGRSISVYHLRYKGSTGVLTITKTSYYGDGSDSSSLTIMACTVNDTDARQ